MLSIVPSIRSSIAGTFAGAGRPPSLGLYFDRNAYSMGAIGSFPTSRAFSDLITFTRASGGGITNSLGQFEWVGTNVPRLTYDPVTLQPLGLLVEEQRTNSLTQSETFGIAPWAANNANVGLRAEGITQLFETADSNFHRIGRTGISITSGQSVTLSVRVKKLGRRYIYIRESLGDGATFANTGFDFDTASVTFTPAGRAVVVEPAQNGSFIISIIVTSTATSAGSAFYVGSSDVPVVSSTIPVFLGDVLQGVGLGDTQLEVGSSASSYIPTTTAQVTRAADVPTVNTLSPWYNATEGTIVIRAECGPGSAALPVAAAFTDGTNSNYMYFMLRNATNVYRVMTVRTGNVEVVALAPPPVPFGKVKIAASYKQDSFAGSFNGDTPATYNLGAVPVVDRLAIGRLIGGNHFNGTIASIEYYPRALTAAELQAITT